MSSPEDSGRRRLDIQGLRAIAVLLVLAYHARVPGFGGGYVGVDVFFVISGFVIMGSLARHSYGSGRVDLARFFARRIRRLMPSALLVLAITALAMGLSGWPLGLGDAGDAGAVALQWSNYRFALTDVDYHAMDEVASPLRHYWSLAVEEQFYVLFPGALAITLRLSRTRPPVAWTFVLAGVTLASFVGSVWTTAQAPVLAFYSAHTRAWEFGAGALVYVVMSDTGATSRRAMGQWTTVAGLAAIAVASATFNDATPFPGATALLPVIGTAIVLAAGSTHNEGPPSGVLRLLTNRVMTWLGDLSYVLYLWHWPLLAIVPLLWRDELVLPWTTNVGLMAGAVGLAWVTHHGVEVPAQRLPLRPARWIAAGVGASVVSALAVARLLSLDASLIEPGPAVPTTGLEPLDRAGHAQVLARAAMVSEVPANLEPPLARATSDVPLPAGAERCHLLQRDVELRPCEFGDPSGAKTILLTGDSHAFQWLPAVDAVATNAGLRVVSWTKTACPLVDRPAIHPALNRAYPQCDQWRERVHAAIDELTPDIVIASQANDYDTLDPQQWADATHAALAKLGRRSSSVLYVLDTPRRRTSMPACLRQHAHEVQRCAIDRRKLPHPGRRAALGDRLGREGITVIDPLDAMCTEHICPPVIGQFLVYRDDDHISATFARQLAPLFAAGMDL